MNTKTHPWDREAVVVAIAEAVASAVHGMPMDGRTSAIGPVSVRVGKNNPDDWWGSGAERAKRRGGNPCATIYVNREPIVTLIASNSGASVLVVVPKNVDVERVSS